LKSLKLPSWLYFTECNVWHLTSLHFYIV